MQRVLFHETVFGPIHSRRLGTSLGINLSPVDGKMCTFDCLYCEAGYNAQGPGKAGLPTPAAVEEQLRAKLAELHSKGEKADSITFSGNGEPLMHPQFPEIMDIVLRLRDEYSPEAVVSVLTNATLVSRPDKAEALARADKAILKLDSAVGGTMAALDRPGSSGYTPRAAIDGIKAFAASKPAARVIVQTMITRGEHDGKPVDNSTPSEIDALIEAYREIGPQEIMLYSVDRPTPERSLQKVPREELEAIAARVTAATGAQVDVA